jgi:PrcB C-terminal
VLRCRAVQLGRLRTGVMRLVFVALVVLFGTAPAASPADPSWLPITPYRRADGQTLRLSLPTETFRAVRSQQEWNGLWQLSTPNQARQADEGASPAGVDFTNTMMLVIALGTRPSAGYSVIIQNAFDDGTVIHVDVLEVRPGASCSSISVVAHPFSIVLVPQSVRPIKFEVSTADLDCNTKHRIVDDRTFDNRSSGP